MLRLIRLKSQKIAAHNNISKDSSRWTRLNTESKISASSFYKLLGFSERLVDSELSLVCT